MNSLENFEIEDLNKEGPLERHHLDFILNNNLIFKFMGEKYKSLFEENNCSNKYRFEWFDFVENKFALFDAFKAKKLNNIFNEILQCIKSSPPPEKIIFLYIGLTEHWILVIYDSFYKNNFIEMDSYSGTKDIINLKYLDNYEINTFVKNINDRIIRFKQKPLDKYQINQFITSIKDTQRILFQLNNIIVNKNFSLDLSILEEKCDTFLQNFNA